MRLWESYIDANGAYGFGVEEVGNTQYAVAPWSLLTTHEARLAP